MTAADGVFLAFDNSDTGAGWCALNPRTGRVEWRFGLDGRHHPGRRAGRASRSRPTLPRRVYLVNPATGRVRWSVATFAAVEGDNPGQLVETAADVVLPEGDVTPAGRRLPAGRQGRGRRPGAVVGAAAPAGPTASNLALLSPPGGRAIAYTFAAGTGFSTSTRLTVRRLGTGRQLASVTLPDMVMAPLTVTGTSVLAQSDSPACANASNGTAVAPQ